MDDIIRNTGLTMGLGCISGASIAILKGYSIPATAFSMSFNWGILALPFYGIALFFLSKGLRSGMMSYRRSVNHQAGVESHLRRDKDEFLSSVFAGSVIGLTCGYFYKGRYGFFPGLVMFSGIAATGQLIFTILRHQRIQWALDQQHSGITKVSFAERIKNGPKFKDVSLGQELKPEKSNWDPIRDGFESGVSLIKRIIDIPDWASPLVNALDADYRKALNYRIKLLEDEIAQLEKRVKD